uniref:Uncharacterized protein n=1 Tax=Amphiprion ocellaris TaxID=80972 RepID=A0AAQ5Z7E3_AMPOC
MWRLPPRRFRLWSERARITLPRASSRVPVFPVLPARSEPARSTRQKRLECSFIPVVPVWRRAFPISTTLSSSSAEVTITSLAPTTTESTHKTT